MKVLHLIGGGDVGGAKVHVLSLVNELSKHIDVKLISFRPGMFADEGRSMGLDIEVVRTGNIFLDIKRVIDIIKEDDYQILHSHGAKANMISLVARAFTNVQTVTTVHSDYRLDYLHSKAKRLTYGQINALALRYIDNYIAVSNNFKNMLTVRDFDPNYIFTLYNGLDFENDIKEYRKSDFIQKYNLDIKENDVLVGVLARLDPVKGLNVFIDGAKEILSQNPSVKFLIGGDGEERKLLEQRVKSLGLSKDVLFLGYINEPYEFMSALDINVLTSISESFPYSILEGARLKNATVSSNVGGISDLIVNGETGFLFEPGDCKSYSDCVLKLINNSDLRKEMGEKIYERAKNMFSLESMCNTQLGIYNTIFSRKDLPKKYHDVIISGYYGSKNSGDDAILMGIINDLRTQKENISIQVFSKDPLETKSVYKVDSINRSNLFKVILSMRKAKLFINGGGSLIQDINSTRSLIYYLGTITLAKISKLKVMLYANGIGPVNRKKNRSLAKRILNLVDVITLREKVSFDELHELGVHKPKVILTADPALTVESVDDKEIYNIFANENIKLDGPFVGFSIRNWHDHENYKEVIAKTADYIKEEYNLTPLFFPMHYPADLLAVESIMSKMKNDAYVIKNKYSVPQMLGIISKMDLLIGMRLHALIFAASLGVPIIGLEYEQKVDAFLKYINQPAAGHVQTLEFESLKEMVDDVWNRKAQIKSDLIAVTTPLKEKARENAKYAIELLEKG